MTEEEDGSAEPSPCDHAPSPKTPVEMLKDENDILRKEIDKLKKELEKQKQTCSDVLVLKIENDMLKQENDKLKKELENQKQTFSFKQISSHPDKVNYYTGLPDAATVFFLESLLSKYELQYHFDWTVQKLPLIDQLLLTLMKLRINCGVLDLCVRLAI